MKSVEVTKAAFDVLIYQIKELTNERDEARRLYCVMAANVMYRSENKSTAEHIANEKNWDCYTTETQEETK